MSPDPTQRFTDRVDDYVKARPSYPPQVVELLVERCGLADGSVVADVGCGTGIFADLLLRHGPGGVRVFGVEPNDAMRAAAARLLAGDERFSAVDASAEQTTLDDHSVDLITVAQAFHWFDADLFRAEAARISRRDAHVALIWNARRTDSTPFLVDYERLLLTHGTDYATVRHQGVDHDRRSLAFDGGGYESATFDNEQVLDWDGFRGRVLSSSYTPAEGTPQRAAMLDALRALFDRHAEGGRVTIAYDTNVFFGRAPS